jgi:coproporphyrinogen III oxidase
VSDPSSDVKRDRAAALVRTQQDAICAAVMQLDGAPFCEDVWERAGGGGGITRVLDDGGVFEKAGVNSSVVHGVLPPETAAALGTGRQGRVDEPVPFFAASLSLVLHPRNPMAPTAHANYRYFEMDAGDAPDRWWFGGGADLTPAYLFDQDASHFHGVHKEVCDRFDPTFYPRFKASCDRYFTLTHRGERRGVGGIFFDHLNGRDWKELFAFVTGCVTAFVPAYLPIVDARRHLPFTERERRWQELRRGRYVEFNLVYDRGTTFGFRTGGRTESILMSLPPTARWQYDHQPEPGSEEAMLLAVLREPREWV